MTGRARLSVDSLLGVGVGWVSDSDSHNAPGPPQLLRAGRDSDPAGPLESTPAPAARAESSAASNRKRHLIAALRPA